MLKLTLKKMLVLFMAVAMVASMSSCGNTGGQTPTSSGGSKTASTDAPAKPGEPIPESQWIKLKHIEKGSGLEQKGEPSLVRKAIAEKTGVLIESETVPEDKFTILMASGSFKSDLVNVSITMESKQAIEGGLLMELDELVANHAPNMVKYAGGTLDSFRKYYSNGTGKLYLVPSHIDRGLEDLYDRKTTSLAAFTRWDLYKDLGSPKVTNEDELLSVLKQMQDKNPKSPDGKKTYAIGRFSGGDQIWVYGCMYGMMHGEEAIRDVWLVTQGKDNAITGNIFEEDFFLWRALKFYNKAYRMGIFDPESFTQKQANLDEKIKSGQCFWAEMNGHSYNDALQELVGPEAGMAAIHTAFPNTRFMKPALFGWSGGLNIASSCKNPEAAIKVLDYLFTPEGSRLLYNGIKGVHWDNVDGKPTIKDEVLNVKNDKEWERINGLGTFGDSIPLGQGIKAEDGFPADLNVAPHMLKLNNTPFEKDYCNTFGADYPTDVANKLLAKGELKLDTWNATVDQMLPVIPEDLNRVMTKSNDCIYKVIPRIIMAKNDAEVASIIAETQKNLKSYGTEKLVDWTVTEYNKSKAELGIK